LWTLDDFQKNLKLSNIGMDPHKDLDSNTITHAKLKEGFWEEGAERLKAKAQ
jgi:hypothetical protein